MPQRKIPIAPEDWTEIVRLYEQGTSAAKLAKRYKLNANTLLSRLRRAGHVRGIATPAKTGDTLTYISNNSIDGMRKEDDTSLEASKVKPGNALDGIEEEGEASLHVQEHTRQQVTLLRRHKAQAHRMRRLLDQAAKDAKDNPLSVKDLESLSRIHERLVKVDRIIWDLEGQARDQANTLVNKGVIVVPAKVGQDAEEWAKAVAKVTPS